MNHFNEKIQNGGGGFQNKTKQNRITMWGRINVGNCCTRTRRGRCFFRKNVFPI